MSPKEGSTSERDHRDRLWRKEWCEKLQETQVMWQGLAGSAASSGMGKGLLQLGARVFGGLVGAKSARRQRRQAQAQFDAQMDETIQRRVADAKKAGIHPLFALGASAGASPTLSSSNTGSAMGDSITGIAEQLGVIDTNRSQARLDEAQAAYYDALTAKAKSDVNSVGRDVVGDEESGEIAPELPPLMTSQNPTTQTGAGQPRTGFADVPPIPLWVETERADGSIGRILNPELNLDEISQGAFLADETRNAITNAVEKSVATRLGPYFEARRRRYLRAMQYRLGNRRPKWADYLQAFRAIYEGMRNYRR